jgi:hypothetical protein
MSRPGQTGPSRTIGAAYTGATCFRQSSQRDRLQVLFGPGASASKRASEPKSHWNHGFPGNFRLTVFGSLAAQGLNVDFGVSAIEIDSLETAQLAWIYHQLRCFFRIIPNSCPGADQELSHRREGAEATQPADVVEP